MLSRVAVRLGIRVRVDGNASIRLHTADEFGRISVGDYDAIIADISKPDVGGVQILKHIQASHSKTPVIVISGNGSEFEDLLMEMGAFAYFTKPFRLERLELAVTQAIAQHQQRLD